VLSPDFDVRQGVAAAGLDPRQCFSGSSLHKKARISKAGNAPLASGSLQARPAGHSPST
jgi:hypothetical protein